MITFLLAVVGLLAGAIGTWYARRWLLGQRIVLPPEIGAEIADGAERKDPLVEATPWAQTSGKAKLPDPRQSIEGGREK